MKNCPRWWTPEAALKPDAPLVHPELGTNVAWSINIDTGEVDAALAGVRRRYRENLFGGPAKRGSRWNRAALLPITTPRDVT